MQRDRVKQYEAKIEKSNGTYSLNIKKNGKVIHTISAETLSDLFQKAKLWATR